jgi:hypothetical protein
VAGLWWLASHMLTTIDMDFRAVDIARRLSTEEIDDLRHFFRLAEAAHGNVGDQVLRPPGQIAVAISPSEIAALSTSAFSFEPCASSRSLISTMARMVLSASARSTWI